VKESRKHPIDSSEGDKYKITSWPSGIFIPLRPATIAELASTPVAIADPCPKHAAIAKPGPKHVVITMTVLRLATVTLHREKRGEAVTVFFLNFFLT
jgi:hypothetical protein